MNHFSYLATGRFDYQYNMKANIATGIIESAWSQFKCQNQIW